MKTEAQKVARQRYKEKNLELVAFEVKKGMSAEYTAAAAKIGLGKMEMIRRAIAEFIARHSGEIAETNTVGEKIPIEDKAEHSPQQITDEELKLLTIFKSLPPKTQKNLLKFLESLQD